MINLGLAWNLHDVEIVPEFIVIGFESSHLSNHCLYVILIFVFVDRCDRILVILEHFLVIVDEFHVLLPIVKLILATEVTSHGRPRFRVLFR